uniref:Transposase n=1 Tax=Haemonchus contortus TaxID=6289 RepID=A0A7I4YYB5_HAECO
MEKEPRITDRHRAARLGFAMMNLGRDWAKVVFSDEKKFSLDGPDGNKRYWRDLRKEPSTSAVAISVKEVYGVGCIL